MRILLFIAYLQSRRVRLEPKETFTFRDRVNEGQIYKFMYQASRNSKIGLTLLDPTGRTMINTNDPQSVLYSKMNVDGEIRVSVLNMERKPITFAYRNPDVKKEMKGALGPIKETDLVADLQSFLENVVQVQKVHIKNHEQHAKMVSRFRGLITKFLVLEIAVLVIVLYFSHKNTLKMFNTKGDI